MKEKLAKIKNKIKQNAPVIIASTAAVAASAYAIYQRNELAKERERFAEGKGTYLAVNAKGKKDLDEGKPLIYRINGHIIDIMYDPDC
jgi:hypothetical protein